MEKELIAGATYGPIASDAARSARTDRRWGRNAGGRVRAARGKLRAGARPFLDRARYSPVPASAVPVESGWVAWIEGLPCAGKTTVSRSVSERLRALGHEVEVLDGDEVRRMFSPDLGFSRKDREMHARRVSYAARMLSRQAARATIGNRFSEIWLKCPVDVCRQRDTKGLYRRDRAAGSSKVTGVDDPFEEPLDPELVIDTSVESVASATEKIVAHLAGHGVAAPLAAR